MKFLRNSFVLLIACLTIAVAARPKFENSKIGVVGCVIDGTAEPLIKSDVESFVNQKLIAKLSNMRVPLTVLDRTKLKEILEEHTIYLSGLVDIYKDERELDLGASDYLIMARITGFTTSTDLIKDNDDMSGPLQVLRSTVSYNLSFEMLNSQTGVVAWCYSEEFKNASYTDVKEEVNISELFFTSLSKSLNAAFAKMDRKIRR